MSQQTVLILDFGGQYKELVARRVRECGVYSVVKPGELSVSEIEKIAPIGIIFTLFLKWARSNPLTGKPTIL